MPNAAEGKLKELQQDTVLLAENTTKALRAKLDGPAVSSIVDKLVANASKGDQHSIDTLVSLLDHLHHVAGW